MVLKVIGIICVVSGLIAHIVVRRKIEQWTEIYVNNQLSDFEDNEIIPETEATEFIENGIKRIYVLYWIPNGLGLLGSILLLISRVIAPS